MVAPYEDHTCDSESCKDASSDSEFTHWNDGCGDSELLMINVAIVGEPRDNHLGARAHIEAVIAHTTAAWQKSPF